MVSVFGTVYNESAFIHKPDKTVSDYLAQAGGARLMPGDAIVVPEDLKDFTQIFYQFGLGAAAIQVIRN